MVKIAREALPPNTNVEKEWVEIELGSGNNKHTYLTKKVRLGAVYNVCDCIEIHEQLERGERLDNICPHCNHLQVEEDKNLEVKERKKLVNAILNMEKQELIRISRTPKIELESMSNEKLFSHFKCCNESMGKLTHDKKSYEIPCIDCGMYTSKGEIEVHGTIDVTPDEFGFHKGTMCHQCYEKELERLEY